MHIYLQSRLSGCPPGALGALLPLVGLTVCYGVRNDNYGWGPGGDQAVSSDDFGLGVNARHNSLPDEAHMPMAVPLKSPLKKVIVKNRLKKYVL